MTTATKKQKPKTPFLEAFNPRPGGAWLGISRLTGIPHGGIPDRNSCQTIPTDKERERGAEIVAAFWDADILRTSNDVAQGLIDEERISHLYGKAAALDHNKVVRAMSNEVHGEACAIQKKARADAKELARVILKRLEEHFDDELSAAALEVEARYERTGIPLFVDENISGKTVRTYSAHGDSFLTATQARRSFAQKIQHELDFSPNLGIQFVRYATTDLPSDFSWM